MLTIVLRQEGFESQMCPRGDHAMDVFRAYKPDLVLLDLMLPGKGGIDVCKEIRAESGVPIVMLTAKGDTVDVVLGLESGRRRLHRQALQAQGARRADPGARTPLRRARRPRRSPSATSRSTWPVTPSPATARPST